LRVTNNGNRGLTSSEHKGIYSSVSYTEEILSKKSVFDKQSCKLGSASFSSLSYHFKHRLRYLKIGLELPRKVRSNNPIDRIIE